MSRIVRTIRGIPGPSYYDTFNVSVTGFTILQSASIFQGTIALLHLSEIWQASATGSITAEMQLDDYSYGFNSDGPLLIPVIDITAGTTQLITIQREEPSLMIDFPSIANHVYLLQWSGTI